MLNKASNNNQIYSLLLLEITGTAIVALLVWILNLKVDYFAVAPIAAIPVGIIFELVGNVLFWPVRKISFNFDLNEKLEDWRKNDDALLIMNISRSFAILGIVILAIIPWTGDRWWIALGFGLTFIIAMPINVFRFEYYFRLSMYVKLPKKSRKAKNNK